MDRVTRLTAQLSCDDAKVRSCNLETSTTSGVTSCNGNHGMAFEEWSEGQKLETKRRTISDVDIIQFTHMTGYDAENLFGDMVYLREVAGHKRRLAPGLLTASVADALIVGSGILEGFAVALVKITDLRATAPVYGGDTIKVELEVTECKPSLSKPDRGIVTTKQRVVNQEGIVVMEYTVSRMLRRQNTA